MSAHAGILPGLARLRGTECHAPYAEAFTCAKSLILCELYRAGRMPWLDHLGAWPRRDLAAMYQGWLAAGPVAAGRLGLSDLSVGSSVRGKGEKTTKLPMPVPAAVWLYRFLTHCGNHRQRRTGG